MVDINSGLNIVIEETLRAEDGIFLFGFSYDDDDGFGGEGIHEYAGELFLHTEFGKSSITAEIANAHVAGKGKGWFVNRTLELEPPYLISSSDSWKSFVSCKVKFSYSELAEEQIRRHSRTTFPVLGNDYLGLVELSNDSAYLSVFSTSKHLLEDKLDAVIFSDWGESVGDLMQVSEISRTYFY